MSDTTFLCDYAKRKSNCKKCKQPIDKGVPRIAKVVPNFFNDGDGKMKQYHHINCMFEVFQKARATTKKIEDVTDLEGFTDMKDEEKDVIRKNIRELCSKQESKKTPKKSTPQKRKASSTSDPPPAKINSGAKPSTSNLQTTAVTPVKTQITAITPVNPQSKDNLFREFRRLCATIADESSYNEKTNIVKTFITKGTSNTTFSGDLYVIIKLLLPGVIKRTYNLQSKQLVKLFSQIFGQDLDEMVEELEQGDVSETVFKFFESSSVCPPIKKSTLTVHDVDKFLENLAQLTREEDQMACLEKITKRCTANDLKTIVRLIKGDLRITAGAKHILDALDPNAHEAFKASKDLADVITRIMNNRKSGIKSLEVRASLMTPVAPMLAEACKSVEQAMKKCPNGMYSEIKYDGERVQLHMSGGNFQFFSRSLKPVQQHKVQHFEKYIPEAFPGGNNMILDSEVLLIDTKTGNPLPFGTLGIHKKSKFENANVCLFVFDILHFNGENLMTKTLKARRKLLEKNMKEIPNRVMFSEMKFVNKPNDLKNMIIRVIQEGLEGLVLKDINSVYEPGKRHWLKVKKDYLLQGQMADTADLVVLGAYYGTGSKGGIMSVFLMGVYDESKKRWSTVTKVGNGHDDKTLDKINRELKTVKISKDYSRVPAWLNVTKQYVPDLVVSDPKTAPVWEITGTEFSKSEAHTADGISIRFPRVTKIRDDKTWETATSLQRLKLLYEKSKEETDVSLLLGQATSSTNNVDPNADFLNDTFKGLTFYIPNDLTDRKRMVRYISAYNGDVVEEFDKSNATHILCDQDFKSDAALSGKVLDAERFWKCVREKRVP